MKKGNWMQTLKLFLSIIIGNAMLSFAVCAFVVPNNLMLGGSSGIALFIQHFLPLRLSVISAFTNAALFTLGWIFLGWKFAATSLASTIIYPIMLAIFETLPVGTLFNENIVFSALACSVMFGVGVGLVIRAGGSTGGMDIPPCILYKYKGIPVGKSVMFFDTFVVLMQVAVKGLDGIICAIVITVVMGYVIDKTVVSGEKKLQIIIISPEYEKIRHAILHDINCGATMLDMETGYTGTPQKAIFTVVYSSKYPQIRDAALCIDRHAFIITSEVSSVQGRGYTIDRDVRK